MQKSLDEFEIWSDPTTDYGVSSPGASEKSNYNVVVTLEPSFYSASRKQVRVMKTPLPPTFK